MSDNREQAAAKGNYWNKAPAAAAGTYAEEEVQEVAHSTSAAPEPDNAVGPVVDARGVAAVAEEDVIAIVAAENLDALGCHPCGDVRRYVRSKQLMVLYHSSAVIGT